MNFSTAAINDFAKKARRHDGQFAIYQTLILLLTEGIKFKINDVVKLQNSSPPIEKEIINDLRLPYPITIMEYTAPTEEGPLMHIINIGVDSNSGNLDSDELHKLFMATEVEDGFSVVSLTSSDGNCWTYPPIMLSAAYDQGGRGQLRVIANVFSEDFIQMGMKHLGLGRDETILHCGEKIQPEISTMYCLMMMLSCSNIQENVLSLSPVKLARNKKIESKRKKAPYFEYRELVLKLNQKKQRSLDSVRKHKSPKQHTRRGHIRRLQSGVNIWIHSFIVGDAINGVIQKDYKVIL